MSGDLAAGLIVAVLTLFWVLAYSHPTEFKLVGAVSAGVALLAIIAIGAWNLAILYAEGAVSPLVAGDKAKALRATLDSLRVPAWLFLGGGWVFSLYLWGLNQWVTKLKARSAERRKDGP